MPTVLWQESANLTLSAKFKEICTSGLITFNACTDKEGDKRILRDYVNYTSK